MDVTTGDMITPREVEYTFSLLFDNRTISILAYNLETVLAKKLETVLSRNIANTRPKDYYDVHILCALRGAEYDKATLRRERDPRKRYAPQAVGEIQPRVTVCISCGFLTEIRVVSCSVCQLPLFTLGHLLVLKKERFSDTI